MREEAREKLLKIKLIFSPSESLSFTGQKSRGDVVLVVVAVVTYNNRTGYNGR